MVVLESLDNAREDLDVDSETLAQSADNMEAAPDLTTSRAETGGVAVARPANVIPPIPDPATPIDDAIDQITAQLTDFCFEQLEKSVTS